ncbi:MAG: hypothetical protein F8N36_00730 [Desulfovibrio sp.]|uniref:hypothetical protein n=1 Tax=Desulfovibrio sp. TaxID=885 RepID=UPI00135DA409|nr:hypothetical protein [Desulfovibrio sp.]MTJ91383.1 hypothetical protein [Desulfovibrio sp.]
METLKMIWRTALFLGAVTVVFVLYTVGVALVERHFSPKYAKKQEQPAPVAEATAPQAESPARAMLDSGQLSREQNNPELQKQGSPVSAERSAGLVAGAPGQGEK